MLSLCLAAVCGYLCGSLNTAIILCRLTSRPDPRLEGSGNPGATNMMRLYGKKLAAITMLGDCIKGVIPVLIARLLSDDSNVYLVAGLAAFLGHLYPLFFQFKGGKGVATAFGVIVACHWLLGLSVLGIWVGVFVITHISSLSALSAVVLAPVLAFLLAKNERNLIISILIMSVFLLIRHRSNIVRLCKGEETIFKNKTPK